MIFRSAEGQPLRHLPTAGAMSHSFELMLMQYATTVKMNLERREVYAEVNFLDGTSRLYTLPITSLHDETGEEVEDPADAVQVMAGGEPSSSQSHSTTRYGCAVFNVAERVHH